MPTGIGARAAPANAASTAPARLPVTGAYDVGSTWSSIHPAPQAASSVAASTTTRSMSAGRRIAARARS
jgi:hypothetical protein